MYFPVVHADQRVASGDDRDNDADVEMGIIPGRNSDTLSMHHFRTASDGYGESQAGTELSEVEVNDKEVFACTSSSFQQLGGTVDTILTMHILVFLNAEDLALLSATNKYFNHLSRSAMLWDILYRRDFMLEDPERRDSATQIVPRPYGQSIPSIIVTATGTPTVSYSKQNYLHRHHEYHQRIDRAKEDDQQAQQEAARSLRKRAIEQFLDFTQVRLLGPIFIGSIFLTIILYCQRVDGLDIAYWMCFLPLLIALFYTLLSVILLYCVNINAYSPTHFLRGLWMDFRGPLVFIYQEILNSHRRLLYGFCWFLVLCILEVMLVATKLSPSTPDSIRTTYLPWAVVFLPIWICLVLYCAIPFTVPELDGGVFVSTIVMFYVPLLVFFVCLTVKLTGEEEGHSHHAKIRLALMLIPFWIIEGCMLLGSLVLFGVGLHG
jgi:hypothetical protein